MRAIHLVRCVGVRASALVDEASPGSRKTAEAVTPALRDGELEVAISL